MANPRILLVEDNPDDEYLTLRALKKSETKIDVDVVRDGAAALDYMFKQGAYTNRESSLPHIVLLDLNLPKVNGLEVLRRIRADQATKRQIVVIMTSSVQEDDIMTAYDNYTNSYIRKPIEFADFVTCMKKLEMYWFGTNVSSNTFQPNTFHTKI